MISVRKLILKILTSMADRVINTGEVSKTLTTPSGTGTIKWICRKWTSGKKEAWFDWSSVSIAVNTQHTNGYRSGEFVAPVPDIGFTNPKVFGTAHNTGTYATTIFTNYYDSANKELHFYVYSGASVSSSSSRTVEIQIYMTEE